MKKIIVLLAIMMTWKSGSLIAQHMPVVYETYEATAYSCSGITSEAMRLMNCPNGITTSGTIPESKQTAACHKNMLGKTIIIEGIGELKCEDTGGAIGYKKVDIYVDSVEKAIQFGRRDVLVMAL